MKPILFILTLTAILAAILAYSVEGYLTGQTRLIAADSARQAAVIQAETQRQTAIIQAQAQAEQDRLKTAAVVELPVKLATLAALTVILLAVVIGLTIYFVTVDRPAPVVNHYHVTQQLTQVLPPGVTPRQFYKSLNRRPLQIEAKTKHNL